MTRKSRIGAPGALDHVIIRGIERKAIFKGDDDRTEYVQRIESIYAESSTPGFAWTLMTNHTHRLCRTGDVPLASLMRRLLAGYAMAFNCEEILHIGQIFGLDKAGAEGLSGGRDHFEPSTRNRYRKNLILKCPFPLGPKAFAAVGRAHPK
jgi:REP element-mobilizing transposase RayT